MQKETIALLIRLGIEALVTVKTFIEKKETKDDRKGDQKNPR